MAEASCSDHDFINTFRKLGPTQAAKALGVTERAVYQRRRNIEKLSGITLEAIGHAAHEINLPEYPQRRRFDLRNGVVIVGSDAHYWPNVVTTAHRAFVAVCRELAPKIVVLNGDVVDGARISRHPRIGWDHTPHFKEELEAATERLEEIENAAPNAKRVWNLGNHDGRFETKLAANVPEVEGVRGMSLQDHFPKWQPAWSTWINPDSDHPVVIKHRYKGGEHSGHNNAIRAGVSFVAGHDHVLKCSPVRDYRGIRYGVHGGFLAALYGPQFVDYTEDAPESWSPGFVVLTIRDGALLPPELVYVMNEAEGLVAFRGRIYAV